MLSVTHLIGFGRGGGGVPSKNTYSIDLDGSNDYGTFTSPAAAPFSMVCRVRGDNVATENYLTLMSIGTFTMATGVSGNKFGVHVPGVGRVRSATALSNSTWYMLGYTQINSTTFNATNTKLYLNGAAETGTAMDASSPANYAGATAYVGSYYTTSYFWNGLLAEMALWTSVLTAAEMLALYNAGPGVLYTANFGDYVSAANLYAQWLFEEGTGTTVADESGNGRTLTLVGTPSWSTDNP
ncbi:MAG: LamG domain-containing protein [Planctomycetes bacterium]|nr:LamG domain-containing protein [Planctomycetota bacterium]